MPMQERLKRLGDRARDLAAEHKEEIKKGLDKAEQLADQRTGGRYHDQLEKTKTKAGAYVEGLAPDSDAARATDDQPPASKEGTSGAP